MDDRHPALQVIAFELGPLATMTYIVNAVGGESAAVVDPAAPVGPIAARLDEAGLAPEAMLLTHGHGDHISGVTGLREIYPRVRIVVGGKDAGLLTDPVANFSLVFGGAVKSPPADFLVTDGASVNAAGLEFSVIGLPGHSRGGVGYFLRPETTGGAGVLFVGDTVFAGSVGRTDFPGGDVETLVRSIREEILSLEDETVLYPGHGPVTTVGRERRTNPFF